MLCDAFVSSAADLYQNAHMWGNLKLSVEASALSQVLPLQPADTSCACLAWQCSCVDQTYQQLIKSQLKFVPCTALQAQLRLFTGSLLSAAARLAQPLMVHRMHVRHKHLGKVVMIVESL